MRIVLFDAIMETHVVSSLARALGDRGHEVATTGQLSWGHVPISDPVDLRRVDAAIDDALAFGPDVVLVFRPTSLPHAQLRRLRRSGAQLMAWFSDDPVLWGLSYGAAVDLYDVILHCGNADVLAFYETTHGRATGVNIPFWTDEIEFPRVGATLPAETEVLFLGNVGDRIRRGRYFDLGLLDLDLRIHGRTGDDYFDLSGGYLDTREEVLDAAARSRLAVNIPQLFTDHHGAPTWFDGLGDLGVFDTPSRIVQYAAMGLPVVSLQPAGAGPLGFADIPIARDPAELRGIVLELLTSEELPALADALHETFHRHFSAASRALALESLAADDSWRRLDPVERAEWFLGFPTERAARSGNAPERATATIGPHASREVETLPSTSRHRVAVIGIGHGEYFSPYRTATRALASAGHGVVEVSTALLGKHSSTDPTGRFSRVVDLESLAGAVGGADTFLFVGDRYLPSPTSRRKMLERGTARIAVHALGATGHSERLAALVTAADAASFLHQSALEAFRGREIIAAIHLPHLVDAVYRGTTEKLTAQGERHARAAVVAESASDLLAHEDLLSALEPLTTQIYILEEEKGRPHGLANLARIARSEIVVAVGAASRGAGHQLLPHLLVGAGVVVLPRSEQPKGIAEGEQAWVLAASGRELNQKLHRLASHPTAVTSLRRAAAERTQGEFCAEAGLDRLLSLAHSPVSAKPPPLAEGDRPPAPPGTSPQNPIPTPTTTAGQ